MYVVRTLTETRNAVLIIKILPGIWSDDQDMNGRWGTNASIKSKLIFTVFVCTDFR